MADTVQCPRCREELEIPEAFRGKPVRCAGCQNVFTPGMPTAPVNRTQRDTFRDPLPDGERDTVPTKRSNAGVWILMLLTLVVVGGGIMALVFGLLDTMKQQSHPYSDTEGKYKIIFPGDGPKPMSALSNNDDVTVNGVQSTQNDGQFRYIVKHYDLPAKEQKVDAAKSIEKAMKEEIAAAGTTFSEVSRQVTQHDTYPALDVWLRGGMFNLESTILRCVRVGNRIYILSARGAIEPRTAWVQRFFVSFTPTP